MDPNELLRRLRNLTNEAINDPDCDQAYALADMFSDLDDWMSSGGFLPQTWEGKR